MGTDDWRKANKQLISDLMKRDLKDLFKQNK